MTRIARMSAGFGTFGVWLPVLCQFSQVLHESPQMVLESRHECAYNGQAKFNRDSSKSSCLTKNKTRRIPAVAAAAIIQFMGDLSIANRRIPHECFFL